MPDEWPNYCPEHEAYGDGNTKHCFHHAANVVYPHELICCWCGDLFNDDEEPERPVHGPYAPKEAE
jgi:hypothetical protein